MFPNQVGFAGAPPFEAMTMQSSPSRPQTKGVVMASPLFAPFAVISSTWSPYGPTPRPFLAWNSSIICWLYGVAFTRLKSTKLQGTDEFGSGDQSEELDCRLGRSEWHEQIAGTARHAERCLHLEFGREPQTMARRRPSVLRLGFLLP